MSARQQSAKMVVRALKHCELDDLGLTLQPGDLVRVPVWIARDLIKAGLAVPAHGKNETAEV